MSFQQGLSGLNGAAKSLDVIGNNIANANTVGFKQSQAQFADIYAKSLNGVGGNSAGIGVSVSQIAQQFTQGNQESSANPLDISINGQGFFRTSVNGAIQYSRNGQFQVDKEGFIVNAQLAKLTGYQASPEGQILSGTAQPLQISKTDMKPQATTKVDTQINLDSKSLMPTEFPFSVNNLKSFTKQTPTEVFDSLGNSHSMTTYYVKTGTNSWDVYMANDNMEITSMAVAAVVQTDAATRTKRADYQAAVTKVPLVPADVVLAAKNYAAAAGAAVTAAATTAGASVAQLAALAASYAPAVLPAGLTPDQIDKMIAAATEVPAKKAGSLIFNTSGTLDKVAMLALSPAQTLPMLVKLPILPATGAAPLLTINVDFTNSTQIANPTSEKKTTQDGYAGGALIGFVADAAGVLVGQYSNGRNAALGQIVLANFANPNGLQPQGNNAWTETNASGSPLVGEPNSGSLGLLKANSVEVSNVDLTAELVNMITAQRAYQANAQTIKTQDQVLQTLVNLR